MPTVASLKRLSARAICLPKVAMAARLSSMERPAASQFVCARRKDWLQRVISACVLRTAARALLRLTPAVLTASAALCVLFWRAVFCPASFLTSCTEARYSVLSASRLARAAMVAESLSPSVCEKVRTCWAAAATCALSASWAALASVRRWA